MRKSRGFTLIELIIVIVVIGVLATITVVGFGRYQGDTRDARRASSVSVIAEALEKYFDKNGEYPSCSQLTQAAGIVTGTTGPLRGVDTVAIVTPQAPSGTTNSLSCADLTSISGVDSFSYIGDGSVDCGTGVSCLQFTLKYKDETDGQIKTITSRHKANISTSTVANLTVTSFSFSQVNLTWTDVSGAASYNIQAAPNNSFSTITSDTTTSSSGASASVTGLSIATTYYFRTRAIDASGGFGAWSNTATATTYSLNAPTGTATTDSTAPASKLKFTWNTMPNATSYTVDYSTSSSFTSPTTTTNATSPLSVSGLGSGQTIYFRVKSVAGAFSGGWSATANGSTITLAAPSLAGGANPSSPVNQAVFTWGDIANETGYTIQYDGTGSFASPTTVNLAQGTTSYTLIGLSTGATYYARVAGTVPGFTGTWSNTAGASTYVPAPYGVDTNLGPSAPAQYMYWWGSCTYGTIYWQWGLSGSGSVGSVGSGGGWVTYTSWYKPSGATWGSGSYGVNALCQYNGVNSGITSGGGVF